MSSDQGVRGERNSRGPPEAHRDLNSHGRLTATSRAPSARLGRGGEGEGGEEGGGGGRGGSGGGCGAGAGVAAAASGAMGEGVSGIGGVSSWAARNKRSGLVFSSI